MGRPSHKLRGFISAFLVSFICFQFVCNCIAAPTNRNSSQNHDAEQLVQEATTSPSNATGRRRFVLRRGASEEVPRTRKRHLQQQTSDPHFQPIQEGVPKENIMSFLEFGQKITSTSANSISDLKHTVTPSYSRLIINIENPTSTNAVSSNTPTTTPSREIIAIVSTSTPEPNTSNSPLVRVITISTPAAISQSDDSFNDIMANSQRRRRKKLIARRLQLNNATEIIADHAMNDTVMNAALVRRKSLLQPQRNNSNSTQQQNVLRRPLIRITNPPTIAKYTISEPNTMVQNTTAYVRNYTTIDRGTTTNRSSVTHDEISTTTAKSNEKHHGTILHNNATTINKPEHNNDTRTNNGNTHTIHLSTTLSPPSSFNNNNNLTVDDENPSIKNAVTNSSTNTHSNNDIPVNNRAIQNTTIPGKSTEIISRVRTSTTIRSSSTTSIPLLPSRNHNNSIFNGTAFIPILPITRIHNASSPTYTRYNYNIESTTRRSWRPVSTMKPVDRHSTVFTEKPSTSTSTEKPTTTTTTTTSTTTTQRTTSTTSLRPIPPKVTEGRMSPSETTFISGDTLPSADFTERPHILGAPRDVTMDDDGPGISVATYALVSLALVTAVGVASYGARHLASRRRRMLDEAELSSSESSSVAGATLKRGAHHGSSTEDLGAGRLSHGWSDKATLPPTPPPPHPQWHFPRDQLRLQTVLGQGNFGQVWKAEAEDICGLPGTRLVAVKSTKAGAGERERSDLLRELAIMQQLGAHPNVVTLLGCCTEQEPHLLIMEYVMYGKLLTFLRDHRTRRECLHFSSSDDGGEQALTSRDLTHFAYCVAKGMDYLVSRGIIHRDLAARNVLVDHNKQCKIADFGMSRHARDSTGQVYEPRQKGALPIRWMAPESLVRSVFTHRSDVWSFGILMWEIVTLGSTPYPTMGAREVMRRVREGYRLERPPHCRPELFRVIASCWNSDSTRRPTFEELRIELRRLRDEGAACPGGGHVDLQSALPPPSPGPNTAPPTAGPAPSDPGGM